MDKAHAIIDTVAEEGMQELDFERFCTLILKVKQGDERLSSFTALMDKIHSTPLGLIEQQTKLRNLKMKFVLVEEREPTASSPAYFVFEVQ